MKIAKLNPLCYNLLMTIPLCTMPPELLYEIISHVNPPVLAILKLVNNFFFRSEAVHEQLFKKLYSHINVTPLPSSWKQLYLARCEAEQNMLKGIFEIETINLPDKIFTDILFTSSQGRSFITYFLENSLFIRDLHQTQPFKVKLDERFPNHCIQECNDKIYLSIKASKEIIIFKIENALEEIFRHPCKAVANSIRLVPYADQPWFYIAATFPMIEQGEVVGGEIKIWNKDHKEIVSNPIKSGEILNSYSENDNYFFVFRECINVLKLDIYNLFTQEQVFNLENPDYDSIGSRCATHISKINNSKILTFLTMTNFWEYELPETSNGNKEIKPIYYQTLQEYRSLDELFNIREEGADLMKIRGARVGVTSSVVNQYFWSKHTIFLHTGLPPHCKSLKLLEMWGARRGHQNYDTIKISEPNGLPILIVRAGHKIKILKFNIKPSSIPEKWGNLIGRIALLALGLFLGYLLIKQRQRIFSLLRSSIAISLP